MIECPWCGSRIVPVDEICPACRHEILPEHLSPSSESDVNGSSASEYEQDERDIEAMIASRFACAKCGHDECDIQETAMTGAGLSKLFDIQHHHYLFVSCLRCGFVEIYNPNILRGKKTGELGTVLDLMFGG
ncbi:zinc ribbon domain-containing protein [Paenibacillus arenilitoris]|uniref:Nucleic acid-binding protein n=1 Tax=Paenibacillus arenilitoris TaxID=2772299 RepID=A0A927CN45_9BACL|nr:zinc ribbon domain-containing protein [Paenibacillus arenilitoris]MBD2869902.1 hypothetical protein [Paenibacillus arenilitoris]